MSANRIFEKKKKNLLTQFPGGGRSSAFRDFGPERRIIDVEFFLDIMHLYVHFLSFKRDFHLSLPSNFSEASSNIESAGNGTERSTRENGKGETMGKNMIFFREKSRYIS